MIVDFLLIPIVPGWQWSAALLRESQVVLPQSLTLPQQFSLKLLLEFISTFMHILL